MIKISKSLFYIYMRKTGELRLVEDDDEVKMWERLTELINSDLPPTHPKYQIHITIPDYYPNKPDSNEKPDT